MHPIQPEGSTPNRQGRNHVASIRNHVQVGLHVLRAEDGHIFLLNMASKSHGPSSASTQMFNETGFRSAL
jgi:hypothetical protein